jgi:hypothetical protein
MIAVLFVARGGRHLHDARLSSRNGRGFRRTPVDDAEDRGIRRDAQRIVAIAITENPGVLTSVRTAYLKVDMIPS